MTDHTDNRALIERLLDQSMSRAAFFGVADKLCMEAAYALTAAQAKIEALEAERDEALNQLNSARHSVDVLEKRVAEARAEALREACNVLSGIQINAAPFAANWSEAQRIEAMTALSAGKSGIRALSSEDQT